MSKKPTPSPLNYRVVLATEYYDRKIEVTVLANDASEAIDTAVKYAKSEAMNPGRVLATELLTPRWVTTENGAAHSVISKAAHDFYGNILSKMDKST